MQPALLFRGILPPPAAGPEVFAGADGTCAGSTADADKTFVVEGVVGDVVFLDKIFGLLKRPIENGMEFGEAEAAVPFNVIHVQAIRRLFRADAGDPNLLVF